MEKWARLFHRKRDLSLQATYQRDKPDSSRFARVFLIANPGSGALSLPDRLPGINSRFRSHRHTGAQAGICFTSARANTAPGNSQAIFCAILLMGRPVEEAKTTTAAQIQAVSNTTPALVMEAQSIEATMSSV